jgi:plastocyanin
MRRFAQRRRVRGYASLASLCLCAWALVLRAQEGAVTIKVTVLSSSAGKKAGADSSNVVVWLAPLEPAADPGSSARPSRPAPQVAQINKNFEPHLLVIQTGAAVEFPNKDPFLHNVFSLFDGKRFDLGFYEAGSSKKVHFDRPGVSFLFCNIHPEMSAAVVAVDTPYFGISDRSGRVTIPGVPDGHYQLNVWYERSLPEELKKLSRTVSISEATRLGESLEIPENPNFTLMHKNKYGQDYTPSGNSSYGRP